MIFQQAEAVSTHKLLAHAQSMIQIRHVELVTVGLAACSKWYPQT